MNNTPETDKFIAKVLENVIHCPRCDQHNDKAQVVCTNCGISLRPEEND